MITEEKFERFCTYTNPMFWIYLLIIFLYVLTKTIVRVLKEKYKFEMFLRYGYKNSSFKKMKDALEVYEIEVKGKILDR